MGFLSVFGRPSALEECTSGVPGLRALMYRGFWFAREMLIILDGSFGWSCNYRGSLVSLTRHCARTAFCGQELRHALSGAAVRSTSNELFGEPGVAVRLPTSQSFSSLMSLPVVVP